MMWKHSYGVIKYTAGIWFLYIVANIAHFYKMWQDLQKISPITRQTTDANTRHCERSKTVTFFA